ncbi:hypothetical protein PENTCL1PPCAC_8917, partial [Pristionchus entomophagus]
LSIPHLCVYPTYHNFLGAETTSRARYLRQHISRLFSLLSKTQSVFLMQLLSLLLVVPLASGLALPTLFEKRVQAIAVTGKLICNGKPYEHAKVKLYDENLALPDRFLAEGKTIEDGTYSISGSTTRYFTIDPKVNIYHNCNDEKVECWRKIQIRIPHYFITDGKETKTFDAGILNISGKLPGEERDCIN